MKGRRGEVHVLSSMPLSVTLMVLAGSLVGLDVMELRERGNISLQVVVFRVRPGVEWRYVVSLTPWPHIIMSFLGLWDVHYARTVVPRSNEAREPGADPSPVSSYRLGCQ